MEWETSKLNPGDPPVVSMVLLIDADYVKARQWQKEAADLFTQAAGIAASGSSAPNLVAEGLRRIDLINGVTNRTP